MALKAAVHERCDRCGGRAARKVGDWIYEWHTCPERPPGPPSPGGRGRLHAGSVVWVPADFDADFLRRELAEAWALVEDLRDKRWKAEEAAREAVREAMNRVYAARKLETTDAG